MSAELLTLFACYLYSAYFHKSNLRPPLIKTLRDMDRREKGIRNEAEEEGKAGVADHTVMCCTML